MSAMADVWLIAAIRTPVAPRGGAFAALEPWQLGAAAISGLVAQTFNTPVPPLPAPVDSVIMGAALTAGGNAARLAALAADLPASIAALTIDTQCCSGLDAIGLAAAQIASGQARAVVAGGLESFSRAPLRAARPLLPDAAPVFYERPAFAPWPDRDPDLTAAAAELARQEHISRAQQEAFARESHRRGLENAIDVRAIAPLAGLTSDAFARPLSAAICKRLPVLAGDATHGLTRATIAVEADAAAAVLLVSTDWLRDHAQCLAGGFSPLRIAAHEACGCLPEMPAYGAALAGRRLLTRLGAVPAEIACAEIMEAYAAQAISTIAALGLSGERVNACGGSLSRGHPIGASGAILAVQLAWRMQSPALKPGAYGLAAIAAAGGLGSALALAR